MLRLAKEHVRLIQGLEKLRHQLPLGSIDRSNETSTDLLRGSVRPLHDHHQALQGWHCRCDELRNDLRHRFAASAGGTREDFMMMRFEGDRDSWLSR
jgi:hypothetical protein